MRNASTMLYGWENPEIHIAHQELCSDIYSNVWSHPPSQLKGEGKTGILWRKSDEKIAATKLSSSIRQHHYTLCENKIRKQLVYYCEYQKWVQDNRCKRYSLSRQDPSPWLPASRPLCCWLQSVCAASRVSSLCGIMQCSANISLRFCCLKFVTKS
jgi:hypothetical protein